MVGSPPSRPTGQDQARIRAIVVDELELDLDPEELDEDADFADDYGADSLSIIQVFARVERELGLPLPKSGLSGVTGLRGIIELAAQVEGDDLSCG